MSQITALLAFLGPLLFIALKVGIVIGGTGSLLEALGNWRNWPKLVVLGQKLEAIGADIPKLVQGVQSRLPPAAAVTALCICLALHSTGCAWFKGSFWPKLETCAPSASALVAQVDAILVAGGDYETALEQLALTDGKAAVECAVAAFVNSLGVADSAHDAAKARGRAFLSQVAAQ